MSTKKLFTGFPDLTDDELIMLARLRKIICHELMMQTSMLMQKFSSAAWLKLSDMLLVYRDLETFPKESIPLYQEILLSLEEMQLNEIEKMKDALSWTTKQNPGESFEKALDTFAKGESADPPTKTPKKPEKVEDLKDLMNFFSKKGDNKAN